MNFVYEQYYVAVGLYFVYGIFKPFFKVAAVFAARNHTCKVERKDYFVLQKVGHLVVDDCLGEAFDHGRLAHARLAYKHGVVLGAAGENLYDFINLFLSADYGVDFALARLLREVGAVLFYLAAERIGLAFAAGGRAPLFHIGRLREEGGEGVLLLFFLFLAKAFAQYDFEPARKAGDVYAQRVENANGKAAWFGHYRREHMLRSRKRVVAADCHGKFCRLHKHMLGARREAVYVGLPVYRAGEVCAESGLFDAAHLQNLARRAVGRVEHSKNYVLAAYIAASVKLGGAFGLFYHFQKVGSEFSVFFHITIPPSSPFGKALVAAYVPLNQKFRGC